MNYEMLTILFSVFGIAFTLDSRFTKQIDEQNQKIERLYEISQKNADNIRDISYYLKTTQTKLEDLNEDVHYIFDLNGHSPKRILKNNEPNNKEIT